MYGWTPTIGDPNVLGWLTVFAYGIAAWLCGRAAQSGPKSERDLWLILAAIMTFLCINKQLDLQTLLTDAGRAISKSHGWYDDRRRYQRFFIGVVIVAGIAALLFLLWLFRRARWPARGAVAGLTVLLMFIVIRASSFEKMDDFINSTLKGVRMNHLLELGGIAIVALCALAGGPKGGRRR